MGSVEAVLVEELQRLRAVQRSYRRAIARLPAGSLQYKQIKGRRYPYLAFRKAGKVVYRYVGRLSEHDLSLLQKQLRQRVQYERLCAAARNNQRRLERMIRGARRTV